MTAKPESDLLYNRKTQILRLMSELKDPDIRTSPTLQQIAKALHISRQRVQQITQMMRQDGLLDPLTFELKLPGDKSDHQLEEEFALKWIEFSQVGRDVPMTTAELAVVIGWNKSTLNTVVKRLIERGLIHKSKWITLTDCRPYTVEDYFWSRIDNPNDPDACWPWKESTTQGYGHLTWRGKSDYAHRVAYELTSGQKAPKGRTLHVAHTCGNLLCCNPRHLTIRTPKESAANRKSRNTNG